MKSLVVITAEELRDAALAVLLTKKAFNGKHVGAFEFVLDPAEPPSRQIRCEVILFDTPEAARRYLAGDTQAQDKPPEPAPADSPTETDLEGKKHGRK